MREYTISELEGLPDLPDSINHLRMYVNIPIGYACKIGKDYEPHLLYNTTTKHVLVMSYWESTCYGDSASDIQFNGHYDTVKDYTASEK
jgi:hypothetical protein